MTKDVVCGMAVDETKTKFHSEYESEAVHFCSAGCKTKFDAAPEKYISPDVSSNSPLSEIDFGKLNQGAGGINPQLFSLPVIQPMQPETAKPVKALPDSVKTQIATLDISGMHCAACVSTVERALVKTEGV
ncbi:MAG: YHS domain-containing protein, partial [Rhizobacter sp.]|nr:YHS domain-containing protein [Chlorobiales bacterium]